MEVPLILSLKIVTVAMMQCHKSVSSTHVALYMYHCTTVIEIDFMALILGGQHLGSAFGAAVYQRGDEAQLTISAER